MKLKTIMTMITEGKLGLWRRVERTSREFYRACFIAAALEAGIYERLSRGPASLDELNTILGAKLPDGKLAAWLEFGVGLGELKRQGIAYSLHGKLSKELAKPENDPQAAILIEMVDLHHALLTETPARLGEARLFSLADSDGELIARSSRILEPIVLEAVDAVVPQSGAFRLLEVGCGSGVYMRQAMARNPELAVVGLELQPDVAAFARRNLDTWGMGERAQIEIGDVRAYQTSERFDLVTLHNNIYYFPEGERVELARRLKTFLKPGGQALFTTGCQGGGQGMQALDLWGQMTEGAGPLPTPEGFSEQLRQAGFVKVTARNLIPGDSFYMFAARRAVR